METIYLLSDPRTNEPRYVGVTSRTLAARMRGHKRAALSGGTWPVARWIRKLHGLGLRPIVSCIEVTTERVREAFWISHYKANYPGMLNLHPGGNYAPSSDPRVAKKIGNALRGRKLSEECKRKISEAAKGRKLSQEHVANMSKPRSAVAKANIGRGRRQAIADGRIVHRRGFKMPPDCIKRGGDNPIAKLTAEDVLQMRSLFARGAATTQIAKKYGISQPNAHRIIVGQTWSHLPGACAPRGQGKKPTLHLT